jgi:hypothetical protein
MARRPALLLLCLAVLALIVALPVLGAQPSAPPGQEKQKEKGPEVAVTLRGTIAQATDDKGRPTFTLTSGGTTWELSAGPTWFHGDNNPLKAFVGQSVTVVGSHREGSTDVSVDTVNGEAIRAAGKPPWAGGWKQVGEGHPGWSQEKADRHAAKFGDCFPPGQCKDKPARGPDASSAP